MRRRASPRTDVTDKSPQLGRFAAPLLALASIAVSLLVLEAGIRVSDGVPLISRTNFVAREIDTVHGTGNITWAIHDARLGWVMRPNFTTPWKIDGKRSVRGDYGARMSGSQVVPLQQGAVLLVGDSFGFGAEVSDADSWPAQLERMTGTQVINAAVGGYGFDQIVLYAEELLPRLKPRRLLVQTRLEFGISVARLSIFGGAQKPYFSVQDRELVLKNEPVPIVATRAEIGWLRSILGHSYLVQYVMTRLDLLQWWAAPAMGTKFALSNGEAVDVTCLLMQRLAMLRDRYGTPIDLVLQYAGVDGTETKLAWEADRARVIGCADQAKLGIVDVLDSLRSIYRTEGAAAYRRLWVMHDNDRVWGHMSAEGNRLVAERVFAYLSGPNSGVRH
jgi:hypothetical protein